MFLGELLTFEDRSWIFKIANKLGACLLRLVDDFLYKYLKLTNLLVL